jgi:tetratricopeptide (TPR) repeat protein
LYVLSKGEDISDTLSSLAIIYQKRQEFNLALSYHTRALMLRETNHPSNSLLIAQHLHDIANANWAQRKLLESAQRALSIYQSLTPINEKNVATSLCTLANIYHDYDNDAIAFELGTQALVLLKRCVPTNSSILAGLYHNLDVFHLGLGALQEARNSFEESLNVCTDILPPEHPKRITLENHIQNIIQLQEKSTEETTNDIRLSFD